MLRHAHARILAWLLGTCISETTADIAGNQTPMPEDQRELYTMQTSSAKESRRRFGETSKQEVETMSKAIMPKNTSARNTRYQLALFAFSTIDSALCLLY